MTISLEGCFIKNQLNNEIDVKNFNKLIEKSLVQDWYLEKILHLCCMNKYKLNKKNTEKLILATDFKKVDSEGYNQIMYIFRYKQLNQFSDNQLLDIMKKSNIKQISMWNTSVLSYALFYFDEFNLNKNQWKYLIENSDLSLIKEEKELMKLKKIQTKLINDEILNKIDIKEENKNVNKI